MADTGGKAGEFRARGVKRVLNVRPDTMDFRDRMYEPTLIEVPQERSPEVFRKVGVPVLDQKSEGACAGFGLATVANYLLRTRQVRPDPTDISPRMFYEMARRYDEWPGEEYEGSSARGAMKGWYKHGICSEVKWPYRFRRPPGELDQERAADARARPLGAYLRVNHRDLVALHTALAEVGVLYATAVVHRGWSEVGDDGLIAPGAARMGGHAFAIVGYDRQGFWIQNSWGEGWGLGGFGRISYQDWLENGTDVWVARLGVPVDLGDDLRARSIARSAEAGENEGLAADELRPHLLVLDKAGRLSSRGAFAVPAAGVKALLPSYYDEIARAWERPRLLLYVPAGLVIDKVAVQRAAEMLPQFRDNEVYPLTVLWLADFWSVAAGAVRAALDRRRPGDAPAGAGDFMLDRIDDALEAEVRQGAGPGVWTAIKGRAQRAAAPGGGLQLALAALAALARGSGRRRPEIHVAGHGAGCIALCHLLAGPAARAGRPRIASCTLWAPACSLALFRETLLPAVRRGDIGRIALYTLSEEAEQGDHVAHVYHRSLLCLIAHALEDTPRVPGVTDAGTPLLGRVGDALGDSGVQELLRRPRLQRIESPGVGKRPRARAVTHGGFETDPATLASTLAFILGSAPRGATLRHFRSASSLRELRRRLLDTQTPGGNT